MRLKNTRQFFLFFFLLLTTIVFIQGNSVTSRLSWDLDTKLVATFYFYWYDAASDLHFKYHDGSDSHTDHPPLRFIDNYSYAHDGSWDRYCIASLLGE